MAAWLEALARVESSVAPHGTSRRVVIEEILAARGKAAVQSAPPARCAQRRCHMPTHELDAPAGKLVEIGRVHLAGGVRGSEAATRLSHLSLFPVLSDRIGGLRTLPPYAPNSSKLWVVEEGSVKQCG